SQSETVTDTEEIPMFSEGLEYMECSDGTLCVVSPGTCKDSVIRIPETVEGKKVTGIDFSTSGALPYVTEIRIPKSVIQIWEGSLSGCFKLSGITVNEENPKYHSAGNCVIETEKKTLVVGCKTSVIPTDGSVTKIGESAFRDCLELTEISIPEGVTEIAQGAFYGCENLVSVSIPNSIELIEDGVFSHCTALSENVYGNAVYYGNKENPHLYLMNGTDPSLTSVVIHPDTKVIGSRAFSEYSALTEANLPNGLRIIGESAFQSCGRLKSIAVPEGVTHINANTFYGCGGLESIVLPESLTEIKDRAFEYCGGLKRLTIPDRVVAIGDYAFSNCYGLTEVKLSASLLSIDLYAFKNCGSLTELILPDRLESIEFGAFDSCTLLKGITIPRRVTNISSGAFSKCGSMEYIAVDEENTTYHSAGNCLIETEKKTLILGCKNSVIPTDGSVTRIGGNAFLGCSAMTEISIPNSVTEIDDLAFGYCRSLTGISIPKGVTNLDSSVIWECVDLRSMTIPDSVTRIGGLGFVGCLSLSVIYYEGGEEDWEQIEKPLLNEFSRSIPVCYYSETEPTGEGSYWRYMNGVPVAW
ncbi:MAG: leucine-rich repeat domain-containing protein, partial [Clostridia bacterium]|nr:leucine-rich repeat domain-containing protein [Clostridia bacterium]